jgi:phosphoribosylanthranilate isomerase
VPPFLVFRVDAMPSPPTLGPGDERSAPGAERVCIKVCGLRSLDMIDVALEAGADRIGLVLVSSSPRAVDFTTAGRLAEHVAAAGREAWAVAAWSVSDGPRVEGLDAFIAATPQIAAVQLHGRETPEDIADFATRCPETRIVKAVGVASRSDLNGLARYAGVDAFLLDARPPAGADREGGFGRPFDWSILNGFRSEQPLVLSGGLTPLNVAEAIAETGLTQVDVSSGVEQSPGVKDARRIRDFISAARAAVRR